MGVPMRQSETTKRHSHVRSGLGFLLVMTLAVSGCGNDQNSPGTDTPAPEASNTSVSTPTTTSLSQEELSAEAERVYRAFFELEQDLFAAGGADELTPEMNDYVMGNYAALSLATYKKIEELDWKMRPGTRGSIVALTNYPQESRDDSLTTLAACIDTSNSPLIDSDGNIIGGGLNFDVMYFKFDTDEKLKIYGSDSEGVETCPVG